MRTLFYTLGLASALMFSQAARPNFAGEVTSAVSDKFSLAGDGKVLTVIRHSETSRDPQDSTLVFNKEPIE
jgi:hypothetical protein